MTLALIHNQYRDQLPMWTVYRPTTLDYAGRWVARMFLTLPESMPTKVIVLADTLEEIRAALPPGLSMIPRWPDDDPGIEETWV